MVTVLVLAGSFFTGCAIFFVIGVLRQGEIMATKTVLCVCCYCRTEADDRGYRTSFGQQLTREEQKDASHGICVECFVKNYGPALEDLPTTQGTLIVSFMPA